MMTYGQATKKLAEDMIFNALNDYAGDYDGCRLKMRGEIEMVAAIYGEKAEKIENDATIKAASLIVQRNLVEEIAAHAPAVKEED